MSEFRSPVCSDFGDIRIRTFGFWGFTVRTYIRDLTLLSFYRSFSGNEQADFRDSVVTLDPSYNVVWSYNNSTGILKSYNPVSEV